MATDQHPSPATAPGSLTPDQIEQQAFARARKGLDEHQVRDFLRRVAGEHVALTSRLAELEEKLRHPSVPSGQQLVDLVGEEVARTLRSAQDSANEVSMRARERATQIERQAADTAERTRADQIERATQDARAIVDAARERGREMVIEARALRERVIGDLNRRRETLRKYIEQLHADRDRVAETYRLMREAVRDAQEKLARFEGARPFDPVPVDAGPAPVLPPPLQRESVRPPAKTPGRDRAPHDEARPKPKPEPPVQPEPEAGREPEPEPEAAAPKSEPAPGPEPEATREPERERAPEPAPEPERAPAASMPELELESPVVGPKAANATPAPGSEPQPDTTHAADVQALFQRLRAAGEQPAPVPAAAEATAEQPGPVELRWVADVSAPAEDLEAELQRARTDSDDAERLAKRDDLLAAVAHDLVRRCKRVLQNEQNDVLDALRRQRGRLTVDKLLPGETEQLSAWTDAMAPAIDEAYVAARAAAASSEASPVFSAPRRIVTGMVGVVVAPLRERLVAAVQETVADDPTPDTGVLAQRIGSRYREWKGQELDSRIADVLAAAYARGVYDAAPEGSRLRWLPAEPGRCPDADDNALEPTARGERFPTGQEFPPAHPGCRCLLVVVADGRGSD